MGQSLYPAADCPVGAMYATKRGKWQAASDADNNGRIAILRHKAR